MADRKISAVPILCCDYCLAPLAVEGISKGEGEGYTETLLRHGSGEGQCKCPNEGKYFKAPPVELEERSFEEAVATARSKWEQDG